MGQMKLLPGVRWHDVCLQPQSEHLIPVPSSVQLGELSAAQPHDLRLAQLKAWAQTDETHHTSATASCGDKMASLTTCPYRLLRWSSQDASVSSSNP